MTPSLSEVLAVLDDELIKAKLRDDEQGHAHIREARATVETMAEALENAQAYVDDAAHFPEQFKPGVVKRHQQQVRDALSRFHGDVQ